MADLAPDLIATWRTNDYGVAHTTIRDAVGRGYRGYRNQWTMAAV